MSINKPKGMLCHPQGVRTTTKLCWKCGNPHEDGDSFCMKCGASFATADDHYQTDGRTVSSKDDTAYLRSAPPKVKKSRGMMFAVIIIALLVVGIMVAVANTGGGSDSPTPSPTTESVVLYNVTAHTATASEMSKETPYKEGFEWKVVELTIYNESYGKGADTDAYHWNVYYNIDHGAYQRDAYASWELNQGQVPDKVLIGGKATVKFLCQVPISTAKATVTVGYWLSYEFDLVYDSGLKP